MGWDGKSVKNTDNKKASDKSDVAKTSLEQEKLWIAKSVSKFLPTR